jgi:hypothetical protein
VKVLVIDAQGKEVTILTEGQQLPGKQELSFNASDYNLGAGVYHIRIHVDNKTYSSQLIYVK